MSIAGTTTGTNRAREDVLALRIRQVRASARSVVMASDLRVSWNRLPGPVVLAAHAASIFRLRTDAPGGIMTGPGVAGKGPAFGGHLASGLPVSGTMRCDAIPPGLTVAAPLRWTMDW
jgi:hypothetical protein